jgi:hypothetical protein
MQPPQEVMVSLTVSVAPAEGHVGPFAGAGQWPAGSIRSEQQERQPTAVHACF